MKQILFFLLMPTVLVGCSINNNSCQRQGLSSSAPTLKLTTRVYSPFPITHSKTFGEGAEIGLFITSNNPDVPGKEKVLFRNVQTRAVRNHPCGIEWICASAVSLPAEPIRLYAYYPYRRSATIDPTAVPIHISTTATRTPSYHYGKLTKGHKPVNSGSPVAIVSMKPILSVLAVEVYADTSLQETFYLEKIQIGNQPGHSAFCQKGILNLLTGQITPIPSATGATVLRLPEPARLNADSSGQYELKVVPLPVPVKQEEIEIRFTLNGRTYRYPVPVHTVWEKGYKYIYRFVFTGEDIRLKEQDEQLL